ncbi:MAG: flagellar filament outer layer protein FlaA, partial [Treponema sp.]|nr:flagellar filament outer layer protein FlaA [Treponema sp.]
MKRYIITVACILIGGILFAQQTGGSDSSARADTAQQSLKEVSVDKFEHEGFWTSQISSDQGIAFARLFEGGPADKQPIAEEQDLDPPPPDKYVLGTRVDFYHRGPASFKVLAEHPIPVEGITKSLSVWVAGRNFNHTLKIIVQDYFGKQHKLTLGGLNFQGWKQLSVAVPAQGDDRAVGGIPQQDYHFANEVGIKIVGFEVACAPEETIGSYYLYLDDLRATTDMFLQENRD